MPENRVLVDPKQIWTLANAMAQAASDEMNAYEQGTQEDVKRARDEYWTAHGGLADILGADPT